MPLCVGDSIFGTPAAYVFREEEYRKSHSGGFLHGVDVCLSDCVVKCAGQVIGFIIYCFLIDCKFDLSNLRSCYTCKHIH